MRIAQHRLAIVLPAYNESHTLAETIRAFHAMENDAYFVIVDNNSNDGRGDPELDGERLPMDDPDLGTLGAARGRRLHSRALATRRRAGGASLEKGAGRDGYRGGGGRAHRHSSLYRSPLHPIRPKRPSGEGRQGALRPADRYRGRADRGVCARAPAAARHPVWYIISDDEGPGWDPERRQAVFAEGIVAVYSTDPERVTGRR